MATIREVAKAAGVSATVVSRVLNNRPGVYASAATRSRIFEAAESLSYRPSASAKALSTGRTMQLAISTADASLQAGNPGQLWRILGFTDAAAEAGYRVVLMPSHQAVPDVKEMRRLLSANAVDGFCLFAEQFTPEIREALHEFEARYVILGDPGIDDEPQVDIDNFAYSYDSVRWLASLGHSRIALAEFADFPGGPGQPHHQKVISGYRAAMDVHCGGYREEWILKTRTTTAQERVQLIRGENPPSAVIVAGLFDGIIWDYSLRTNGIRVPEEAVILSYISTLESVYLEPGVAYHAHDLRKMGSEAGRLLIEWIETGSLRQNKVFVPAEPPAWREL